MESPLCFEETNVFPVSHMFARIFFRVELSEQIFFFEGTRFLRGGGQDIRTDVVELFLKEQICLREHISLNKYCVEGKCFYGGGGIILRGQIVLNNYV
jgi:hypothetical protein